MRLIANKVKFALMLAIIVSFPLFGCEENNDKSETDDLNEVAADQEPVYSGNMFAHIDQMPLEELSDAEKNGLLFLREEEKLARDVYTTLYELFPLRPFLNISKSEQQHMDAIKYLLDRYELDDPAENTEIGIFKNQELQDLYNALIESGKKSEVDALKAGALIEETDIMDIRVEIDENVDNEDLAFVYENLLNGSKNHLRAFTRVLSRYGVIYTPEILEQSYYDEIVTQ